MTDAFNYVRDNRWRDRACAKGGAFRRAERMSPRGHLLFRLSLHHIVTPATRALVHHWDRYLDYNRAANIARSSSPPIIRLDRDQIRSRIIFFARFLSIPFYRRSCHKSLARFVILRLYLERIQLRKRKKKGIITRTSKIKIRVIDNDENYENMS